MVDANGLADLAEGGHTEPTRSAPLCSGSNEMTSSWKLSSRARGTHMTRSGKASREVLALYSASDAEQFPVIVLPERGYRTAGPSL